VRDSMRVGTNQRIRRNIRRR